MKRVLTLTSLMAAIVLLSAAAVTGQDKKDKAKAKQLPQNYGKLGLSDDQKKKIYGIQDDYGAKIAALTKQLDDLKKKQRDEMAAVLSNDQKEQLKKIFAEKTGDLNPTPDKKPVDKSADKKPVDK